jgi:hypothetical protein
MDRFDIKIPLQIGLTAYVAVVALGLITYFFYQAMFLSPFLSSLTTVFYISMILMLAIWSGITYRTFHHNIISFSHAFLAIYMVFAFCCLGNVFSELLVNKLIDKDFPHKVYEVTVQKKKMEMDKKNIPDDEQKAQLAQIRPEDYTITAGGVAISLVKLLAVSALFSLLVAMFIKRSSEDLIRMNEKNTITG